MLTVQFEKPGPKDANKSKGAPLVQSYGLYVKFSATKTVYIDAALSKPADPEFPYMLSREIIWSFI